MPDNNVDPRLLISSFLICRHPCATPTTREKEMDRVCTLVCRRQKCQVCQQQDCFHKFAAYVRGKKEGKGEEEREKRGRQNGERGERREERRKEKEGQSLI